jgi:signal transduction histidine kinase
LLAGFSALVILIAFSGFSALNRARNSYTLTTRLYTEELGTEQVFGQLRSCILQSAIAMRDLLLSPDEAAVKRAELRSLERSSRASLETLRTLIPAEYKPRRETLGRAVDGYWRLLEPPKEEVTGQMLRTRILPQRQAVLALAGQIEDLTRDSIQQQRRAIDRRQAELPSYVFGIIGGTILVGLLVAGTSLMRIAHLEDMAAKQHQAVVSAEDDLRRLSQQLVKAQEEERRSLSRDLHDQIGQVLTALRIGIGNLEGAVGHANGKEPQDQNEYQKKIQTQLDQAKRLSEQALRSVRDIAMGLRPAMLDDLGLGAALEWQVRQFSRLCGVPVSVAVEGDLEQFSDAQRTCIYRVVQEALNNVSRHAKATEVMLLVAGRESGIAIEVRDNGDGFDRRALRNGGLGLVGLKERVRQLGGEATVDSKPGEGATLHVWLPVTAAVES